MGFLYGRKLSQAAFFLILCCGSIAKPAAILGAEAAADATLPTITEPVQQTSRTFEYAHASAQTTGKTLGATSAELTDKIVTAIQSKGLQPVMPFILMFHGATPDPDKPFTLDVGVAVSRKQVAPDGITISRIPAHHFVTVTVTGRPADVLKGYGKIYAMIAEQHLTPSDVNEEYLRSWDGPDSTKNVFELRVDLTNSPNTIVARPPEPPVTGSGSTVTSLPPARPASATPTPPATVAATPHPAAAASPASITTTTPPAAPPLPAMPPVSGAPTASTPPASSPDSSHPPTQLTTALGKQGIGPTPLSAQVPIIVPEDPYGLKMPGYIYRPANTGAQVRAALNDLRLIAEAKAELSGKIAAARSAYWAAYPSGSNLDELGQTYAEVIGEKAKYYMGIRLLDSSANRAVSGSPFGGGGIDMARRIDQLSAAVDGGFDPHTLATFNAWASKIELSAGGGHLTADSVNGALARAQDEYQAFALATATQEFLLYSPTSPSHSTDPAVYFRLIAVRGELCATFEQSDDAYQQFCSILGKPIVEAAVNQVRLLPKKNDPFLLAGNNPGPDSALICLQEKLTVGARDSSDMRIYGLYALQGDHRNLLERWKTAQMNWTGLSGAGGEEKLRSVLADVRARRLDHVQAALLIQAKFPALVLFQRSLIEPVYDFSNLGGTAWSCLVEGSDGSLIGMRRGSAPNQAEGKSGGLEIVRLDPATGELKVILSLTKNSVPGRSGLNDDPIPGSLLARGGWLYGTDGACGLAFKLREDGQGFSLLNLSAGAPAMFTGFDSRGNILGTRPHEIFSLSGDGGSYTTLVNDSSADLGEATLGADGNLYFLKQVSNGSQTERNGFPNLASTLMKIGPGARASAVRLNVDRSVMILGPLSKSEDGRLFGLMTDTDKSGNDRAVAINVVGSPDAAIRIYPANHPFRLFHPMQTAPNGRMYGISYAFGTDAGRAFSIDPDAATNTSSTAYRLEDDFNIDTFTGCGPATGLILHRDGTLFGVMSQGGEDNGGTLYHILPATVVRVRLKDDITVIDDGAAHEQPGALVDPVRLSATQTLPAGTEIGVVTRVIHDTLNGRALKRVQFSLGHATVNGTSVALSSEGFTVNCPASGVFRSNSMNRPFRVFLMPQN